MSKVIGFRSSSFKGQDGNEVSGVNLYLTFPLDNGVGEGCERWFLVDRRLAECGYTPHVGDNVRLEFNRFGKVSGVYLIK